MIVPARRQTGHPRSTARWKRDPVAHVLTVMSAGVVGLRQRPRRPMALGIAIACYTTAVVVTWLGSADPPIDLRNSAYWYRTLSKVPGLLDVCGDFTWAARLVPPLLALVGSATAFFWRPRSRAVHVVAAIGLILAIALGYATMQNAVPWGELNCILD